MKLENQVVSLELAKRLKELGVNADSQFYWEKLELKDWEKEAGVFDYCLSYFYDGTPYREDRIYKAYTVAELGEMLVRYKHEMMPDHSSQDYFRGWYREVGSETIMADTEADVRAMMLIYLIENNLTKLITE